MGKNKKIVVRVDEKLHKFLLDFSKYNGMTVSEFVRNILNYFLMQYFLNFYSKPINLKKMFELELPKLRDELLDLFKNKKGKK